VITINRFILYGHPISPFYFTGAGKNYHGPRALGSLAEPGKFEIIDLSATTLMTHPATPGYATLIRNMQLRTMQLNYLITVIKL
jgi:hypothetical protein